MSEDLVDPRQEAHRRAIVRMSSLVVGMGALLVAASGTRLFVFRITPRSLFYWLDDPVYLMHMVPALTLPGLVGLQVGLRGRQGVGHALLVRVTPIGMLLGGGVMWADATGMGPQAGIAAMVIAAATLVGAIPSGRSSPVIRRINCIALLTCALLAGCTLFVFAADFSWPPLPDEIAIPLLGGIIPGAASIALCVLIAKEREGGLPDE